MTDHLPGQIRLEPGGIYEINYRSGRVGIIYHGDDRDPLPKNVCDYCEATRTDSRGRCRNCGAQR